MTLERTISLSTLQVFTDKTDWALDHLSNSPITLLDEDQEIIATYRLENLQGNRDNMIYISSQWFISPYPLSPSYSILDLDKIK